jgi:hypothetical protein
MRAKADATERHEKLTLGFPHLRLTPHSQAAREKGAVEHVNVNSSRVETSTRAIATAPTLEPIPQSSKLLTNHVSAGTSSTEHGALLRHLHDCSAAISRLTSTINTAFLNLSVAQTFDADTFTDCYQALKT